MEKYRTAGKVTDDNTIWRMRFACWITEATDTHSQYVTLIAFRRQQWLHQSALMLRYTYFASHVCDRNAASLQGGMNVPYKTLNTSMFETPRQRFTQTTSLMKITKNTRCSQSESRPST